MSCAHHKLMLTYAKEAAKSPAPWKNWEFRGEPNKDWTACRSHPKWHADVQYRRKEVYPVIPEPVRHCLGNGTIYYIPEILSERMYKEISWTYRGDTCDLIFLERGLIHLHKEDAIEHAKVLLKISEALNDYL